MHHARNWSGGTSRLRMFLAFSTWISMPKSVAVPALREQHVEALHAFVAGNHVEVCPVKDVAHVEFA